MFFFPTSQNALPLVEDMTITSTGPYLGFWPLPSPTLKNLQSAPPAQNATSYIPALVGITENNLGWLDRHSGQDWKYLGVKFKLTVALTPKRQNARFVACLASQPKASLLPKASKRSGDKMMQYGIYKYLEQAWSVPKLKLKSKWTLVIPIIRQKYLHRALLIWSYSACGACLKKRPLFVIFGHFLA